jgi:hypothetical protein
LAHWIDSRNSKLLVTTLCRNLAELYSPYAAKVLSILETNSKAVHAGLRTHIDELLAKPWQASIAQQTDGDIPTPIVVVDALDESDCGTEFLLHVIRAGQLAGIKFLVTSRPDPKSSTSANHSLLMRFASSMRLILPMSKTTLRSTCVKHSQN